VAVKTKCPPSMFSPQTWPDKDVATPTRTHTFLQYIKCY
jgi:hypothetical protein